MGSNEKTFAIIVLCGIIGIIFAIILQVLNGYGIGTDLFTSGTLTLPMLQVLVIVVWEIIGIVVAAVES